MEKCPREASFTELYPVLGDQAAQDLIRQRLSNKHHCAWLQRDAHACEAMPSGVDGAEAGAACPHNVYVHHPEIFMQRDAAMSTIDRVFRLVGASKAGLLAEAELDPTTATELLTALSEIERLKNEHERKAYDEAKRNSELGKSSEGLPPTMGQGSFGMIEK